MRPMERKTGVATEWPGWDEDQLNMLKDSYREVTGHWPDFSNQEDLAKLGAEAFAFVNLSVPLASMRDEMTELYNHCLEQLSSADPREVSWRKRMGAILVPQPPVPLPLTARG